VSRAEGLLSEERRRAILHALNRDGRVLVKDLAENFQISQITIRKDLEVLHAHGLLHRTHGGALPPSSGALSGLSVQEKEKLHRAEKHPFAFRAASCTEIGRCLP
jgi:DeoR family transcriptional regulator of aga operon